MARVKALQEAGDNGAIRPALRLTQAAIDPLGKALVEWIRNARKARVRHALALPAIERC